MADDQLFGHTVLLVEDEPFILEDVKAALEEAGARAAQSVGQALDLLGVEAITASVLDFKLKGGTADDLCHQLTERKQRLYQRRRRMQPVENHTKARGPT
jgi:DNA-binding response OmpR family regulator